MGMCHCTLSQQQDIVPWQEHNCNEEMVALALKRRGIQQRFQQLKGKKKRERRKEVNVRTWVFL